MGYLTLPGDGAGMGLIAGMPAVTTTKEEKMKIMPTGDYYVWYCDWCDSKNLTLWTRIEKGDVQCGACHRGFRYYSPDAGQKGPVSALSRIL
jgi:hypothetical protein